MNTRTRRNNKQGRTMLLVLLNNEQINLQKEKTLKVK